MTEIFLIINWARRNARPEEGAGKMAVEAGVHQDHVNLFWVLETADLSVGSLGLSLPTKIPGSVTIM